MARFLVRNFDPKITWAIQKKFVYGNLYNSTKIINIKKESKIRVDVEARNIIRLDNNIYSWSNF